MSDPQEARPDPCATLGCAMREQPVETCRDHRCPHRWQREAAEDRKRREEKDRQRGMVAARIANLPAHRPAISRPIGPLTETPPEISQADAARAMNVSRSTVAAP